MRIPAFAFTLLAAGCASVEPTASGPPAGPWRLAVSPAFDPGGQPGLIWLREADLGPEGAATNRHWEMSLRGDAGDEVYYRTEYDCRGARYRQLEMTRLDDGAPVERAGGGDWYDIIPHTPPRAIMRAACGETTLETGAADATAARAAEAALRARWAAAQVPQGR